MESILHTFGIDWRLLAINIVNFGLLMFGLWYFLYGPVMRMLEERKQKIAQGVAAADRAQQSLLEIESQRDEKLAAAAREAEQTLAFARAAASAKEKQSREAAQKQAQALLCEAQAQAGELKAKALSESKEEVAKLIVLGIEKNLAT